MIFVWLFLIFIYFGFLCLSGGSSLLQFYIDELVYARHWMTLTELGNLLAISQVTPGPIGVNLATFIGYQQGGILGGFLATSGLLIPSFFLMSMAVHSYHKWQHSNIVRSLMFGIKPITAALIVTAIAACLGMSILTAEIPFDYLWTKIYNFEAKFMGNTPQMRWEMLPILIYSIIMIRYKILSIMMVIFTSAALGVLLHSIVRFL